MTEDKKKEIKRKPLTLSPTGGMAKNKFGSLKSSNTVVVEKKRRRVYTPDGGAPSTHETTNSNFSPVPVKKENKTEDVKENTADLSTQNLSSEEIEKRRKAIQSAKLQEEEKMLNKAMEIEKLNKIQEEELKNLHKKRKEAELQKSQQIEEKQEVRIATDNSANVRDDKKHIKTYDKKKDDKEEQDGYQAKINEKSFEVEKGNNPLAALGGRIKTKKQFTKDNNSAREASSERRRSGKLTIANALDDEERQRSLASLKRSREKEKLARKNLNIDKKIIKRDVIVPDTITVQELASRMSLRAVDLIRELMKMGQMVTANAVIDADTATLIVEELGHNVKRVSEMDIEENLYEENPDAESTKRPAVVTIMGHVDHGKTSLLDALRSTNVVSGEAGGITQHIGAYQVKTDNNDIICFLDTPGHAAFTQMRARGSKITDIVVIVVAANDSVKPQTIEAISHAKAANVPIIIAINKIDLPDANPEKVVTDLLQHEIQCESVGGDIQDIKISAKNKENLDGLLQAIILQAEMLELKAKQDQKAKGVVIEAQLDKEKGPQATFLVQNGTLKVGDIFIVGSSYGRVRAMVNDKGQRVNESLPSSPVEIIGLYDVPEPGDEFIVVNSEQRAREVANFRKNLQRDKQIASSGASLESMMAKIKDAEVKELNIIIKSDVQGSLEAITSSLEKLNNDEVKINILQKAVGGITKSDVVLASSTMSPIIGFNVRAQNSVKNEAEKLNVEIRYYSIIYELIDDIKDALSGMLSPELKETFLGNAEILEVFSISKFGKVAGCLVKDGHVKKGAKVRLIRDDVVIHEGELSQLKRFKDDVNEVRAGQECGMSFAKYDDLKENDIIECFEITEIARSL